MKTRLRQLREALSNPKVTQEVLAKAAGVTVQWYRQLENSDQATSYSTAKALLAAINKERTARGLSALVLDDLSLTIV